LIKDVTLSFEYQCPKTKEFVKIENFPIERTELYGDEEGYYISIALDCSKCLQKHELDMVYGD